jgi:hypothetical protein
VYTGASVRSCLCTRRRSSTRSFSCAARERSPRRSTGSPRQGHGDAGDDRRRHAVWSANDHITGTAGALRHTIPVTLAVETGGLGRNGGDGKAGRNGGHARGPAESHDVVSAKAGRQAHQRPSARRRSSAGHGDAQCQRVIRRRDRRVDGRSHFEGDTTRVITGAEAPFGFTETGKAT